MKKSEIILTTIHLPLDFLMLILAGLAAYFLRFAKFFTAIKPVIFNLTFEKYFPEIIIRGEELFPQTGDDDFSVFDGGET